MKRKRGLPNYPGSRSLYIRISGLTLIEAVSIIAQAVFISRAITFLFSGSPLIDVLRDLAFFLISFAVRHLCERRQTVIAEHFSEKTGKRLRQKLVEAYFKNGQQFVRTFGTGRLVTLAVEGIDKLKTYIQITIPRMIKTFIIPLLLVIYVATLDLPSAGILVVTVPIIILFMILLGLAAQRQADKQYETYQRLSNHFIDALKGLETLKYLGQSEAHAEKVAGVSKNYRKATMKTLRLAFLSSFALDFFTSLSIAFVAVGLGFRLIDGTITLLPALTILILAPEYFSPIKQVGKDYHATLDGQVAQNEIEQILDRPILKQSVETGHQLNAWRPNSRLQLDDITVQVDDHPILKDINFSWNGNGLIGIVGESGAGKTTFINMLAGFSQTETGKMNIDGIETNTLYRDDWLELIAYIPQHPYIFPTTFANNIRFYEPDATDATVEKVIQSIGLQDFVAQLPNGIHEHIGEGGRSLSGGQEQRVAMARALLSQKPIILLDEPTAHLDIETEYEIKQVMLNVFKDKLVFFATHRVHWMKSMDHLLVLREGKLVEQGTHASLGSRPSFYKQLTGLEVGCET